MKLKCCYLTIFYQQVKKTAPNGNLPLFSRPAIESQAKILTKRKIILRNFKCEKKSIETSRSDGTAAIFNWVPN